MLEKLKGLSRDTLIYGFSTIIGRFLNFILVPYYTSKFLPAEYGVVALLYSYIAILNVFFSIGLESGYMRFASIRERGTDKENFSNPYILNVFNSLLLSIVIFAFAGPLSELIQVGENYTYLVKYMAAILFFDSIVLIPFAYLRLNNKAAKFAVYKIINIVINIALNYYLISVLDMGIEAIFISNLISSAFTLLMLLPLLKSNWTFSWNKLLVSDILRFSLPLIPAGIAANIIQIVDRPILRLLSDDQTVGIYQANYKLGIFMMLIVSMFEYAWRPFYLNNANDENAKQLFSKVLTYFIAAGSLLCLALSLYIEDIVRLELPFGFHLIGSKYWSGLDIVPIILFSYLIYGFYVNFLAGINICKKTSYLPVITIAGAVVNIAAIFLLFPVMGLKGVALATMCSYLTMSALVFAVSNRFYPVKYEYLKVFAATLTSILLYIAYTSISAMVPLSWLSKLLFPAALVVVMLAFNVFSFRGIMRLIRR